MCPVHVLVKDTAAGEMLLSCLVNREFVHDSVELSMSQLH